MKKVYIELTDEQKRKLFDIQDKVALDNSNSEPGMALAQIHFTGRDAVMICGFIPHDVSLKIHEVIAPGKKMKIAGDKYASAALKKARGGAK